MCARMCAHTHTHTHTHTYTGMRSYMMGMERGGNVVSSHRVTMIIISFSYKEFDNIMVMQPEYKGIEKGLSLRRH